MKKIHEILRLDPSDGDIGLEFEAEGTGMREVRTKSWMTERDGSLRGTYPEECAEFVLKKPVKVDEAGKVMDELLGELPDAKFDFSFRTSSHVHVNVQDLTEDEMLAFLYLVLILEKPLMGYCGESRQGNRFCLRVADAEGYVEILEALFKRCQYTMQRLDGNQIRYAAINIHSLRKYGSIEFRGMRGNISKAVMIPWCETLIHMRDYAKKLGSPVAVYNKYIATATEVFAKESMGKHSKLFNSAESVRDIAQSFSLTIDLPHAFKSKVEEVKVRFRAEMLDKAVRGVEPDRIVKHLAGDKHRKVLAAAIVAWDERIADSPVLGVGNWQARLKGFLEEYQKARADQLGLNWVAIADEANEF